MFYLVLGDDATAEELRTVVVARFEERNYTRVGPSQWLVFDDATTAKSVWEKLFGEDYDDPPISVVIPFDNYHGVHYSHVWGWKRARAEKA